MAIVLKPDPDVQGLVTVLLASLWTVMLIAGFFYNATMYARARMAAAAGYPVSAIQFLAHLFAYIGFVALLIDMSIYWIAMLVK